MHGRHVSRQDWRLPAGASLDHTHRLLVTLKNRICHTDLSGPSGKPATHLPPLMTGHELSVVALSTASPLRGQSGLAPNRRMTEERRPM